MTAIFSALNEAFTKPVSPERGIGCGRIYVSIHDKEQAKQVAKATKKLGKMWLPKAYGAGSHVIYIGYDNCDGRALAMGTEVVRALQGVGVGCSRIEVGD